MSIINKLKFKIIICKQLKISSYWQIILCIVYVNGLKLSCSFVDLDNNSVFKYFHLYSCAISDEKLSDIKILVCFLVLTLQLTMLNY